MGERINLQYTIELDELEVEVDRLLSAARDQLNTMELPLPDGDIQPTLSLSTLENIDNTRQKLAKLDYCLRDITNIIGAYVNYRTALSQESEPDNPQESMVVDESPPQE
jgi:hypothetical protein|tara:strand:- start:2443 stop:2769 length:327 start_codon:yes stop_codon:yes gene_type:complete